MRFISITIAALALVFLSCPAVSAQYGPDESGRKAFREALRLYDHSMLSASRNVFDEIKEESVSSDPEGFEVLTQVRAAVPGYEIVMDSFLERNPHSLLAPQIKWHHAMNLFDGQEYGPAGDVLENIKVKSLMKGQKTQYLFTKAYCDLEARDLESAEANFRSVEKEQFSDYTAPSRYALGYINYVNRDFGEAVGWFEKARKDSRFAQM